MDAHRPVPSPELLLEHAGWLRRLAEQLLRDPQAADDVVQETWIALLRRGPDASASLRPWLAQVLRRRVALRMRSRANRRTREQRSARSEALPSAGELVERAEVQRQLVEAVLALDEPYRETLLLRHYEGLTAVQIAERRGVPAATVRSQLRRGRDRLRQSLDTQHGGERARWTALLIPLTLGEPRRSAGGAGIGTSLFAVLGAMLAVTLAVLGLRILPDRGPGREVEARGERALDAPTALAALGDTREPRTAMGSSTRTVVLTHPFDGSPLEGYALIVDGGTVVSDREGRVSLPASVASVVPLDDARLGEEAWPTHYGTVRRRYGRSPLALSGEEELSVPAGPTFALRLTADAHVDLSTLEARLVGRGLSPYREDGRPRPLAPLRGTPGAVWVRFGASPEGADDPRARWTLEVRDRSGHAFGEAVVQDVRVGDAEPVEVALERCAVLDGTVQGEGGVDGLEIVLTGAPVEGAEAPLHYGALDATGEFRFPWVRPGAYTLDVRSPRHPPWETTLSLAPGEPRTLDIELEGLPVGGTLAGVVRSESGSYAEQLLLFATTEAGDVVSVVPTTWRDAGGARVARFAFEELPGVPLRLAVISLGDAVTATVEPTPLRAPCATVDVVLHDAGPASDVRIDVVDQGTGAPLEAFAVEFVLDGAPRTYRARGGPESRVWTLVAGGMRWNDHDGAAVLRRLPDGTSFTFTVRADGYRSRTGDETDLVRTEDGAFDIRLELVRE